MQSENKNPITSAIELIQNIQNNPEILDRFSNEEKKQVIKLSQEIISILEKKERQFPVDAKIFNDLMSLKGKEEGGVGVILYPEERGGVDNKAVEKINGMPKFNRGYTV